MGWQDAPLVSVKASSWQDAPLVGTPGAMPAPPISGSPDLNWQDPGYQEAITPREYTGEDMSFTGDILPVSGGERGGMYFDPDAGILGGAKRTATLTGEVMKGEVDPLSDEGLRRGVEAASFMTPISAAARVPGSVFASKTVTPKAPTREALKEATDAGYKEAKDMGAAYTPSSLKSWADDTATALDKDFKMQANYPRLHAILNKLRNPAKDAEEFTLQEVDSAYRELGTLGGDEVEGAVASMVQKNFDEFFDTLDPSKVISGKATPQEASAALKEARGNAAAGFRSDDITKLGRTIERRTASAASGGNLDNTVRQRLTSLIESKKGSRGLSKQEEQAIDNIIEGTNTKNALRFVGNLLGGGGGLGAVAAGGMAGYGGYQALGPMGLALMAAPAVGAVSKGMANRMSAKELRMLEELMRSRSPLHAGQGGPKQMPVSTASREAMLKAMLSQQTQQQPNDMQNALQQKWLAQGGT